MEIEYCQFPDDLLYDAEGLTWLRKEANNLARVGITSIFSALAGKVLAVRFKDVKEVEKGRGISSIESPTYYGIARTPIRGKVLKVNSKLISSPWLVNDSPYGEGWLVLMEPTQIPIDENDLSDARSSQERLLSQIKELRVRCFAAIPDYEMVEVGVECAMVLAKLNDLMTKIPVGNVVHIVSDDPTTPIEMRRWAEQTGQRIVEVRKEDKLYHVIVRKAKQS